MRRFGLGHGLGAGRDTLGEERRHGDGSLLLGRGLLLGGSRLHRREALRRQRLGVLVLGQPDARLLRFPLVAHDLTAGGDVAVDLGEQLFDQPLGRNFLQRASPWA